MPDYSQFTADLTKDSLTPAMQSDGRIIRSYKKSYYCTNPTALTTNQVLEALGVAQGDTLDQDPFATLRSCPVNRRLGRAAAGAPAAWDVDLEYSTEAPLVTTQNADDPTQLRTKRWWSTTEEQRYIIRHRLGDRELIVNSANEAPAGGIPVNIELPVLTYERNEADFSSAIAKAWSGKMNLNAFCGNAPGTLKLRVTGEEVYEAKFHYWRVRYEMILDEEGWQPKWVNAGLRELDASGNLVPIMDGLLEVTDAWPLDKNGHAIARSSLPGAAIFNDVNYRESVDFQKLGLPEF